VLPAIWLHLTEINGCSKIFVLLLWFGLFGRQGIIYIFRGHAGWTRTSPPHVPWIQESLSSRSSTSQRLNATIMNNPVTSDLNAVLLDSTPVWVCGEAARLLGCILCLWDRPRCAPWERQTEECAAVRLDVLAARVSRFRMRKKTEMQVSMWQCWYSVRTADELNMRSYVIEKWINDRKPYTKYRLLSKLHNKKRTTAQLGMRS
jgi:hypothetical protein